MFSSYYETQRAQHQHLELKINDCHKIIISLIKNLKLKRQDVYVEAFDFLKAHYADALSTLTILEPGAKPTLYNRIELALALASKLNDSVSWIPSKAQDLLSLSLAPWSRKGVLRIDVIIANYYDASLPTEFKENIKDCLQRIHAKHKVDENVEWELMLTFIAHEIDRVKPLRELNISRKRKLEDKNHKVEREQKKPCARDLPIVQEQAAEIESLKNQVAEMKSFQESLLADNAQLVLLNSQTVNNFVTLLSLQPTDIIAFQQSDFVRDFLAPFQSNFSPSSSALFSMPQAAPETGNLVAPISLNSPPLTPP